MALQWLFFWSFKICGYTMNKTKLGKKCLPVCCSVRKHRSAATGRMPVLR